MKAENKETVYRVYLTDMLRLIVHNTAVYGIDGEGRYKVEARYADMIDQKKKKPREQKKEPTSEDIIARMKKKLSKL